MKLTRLMRLDFPIHVTKDISYKGDLNYYIDFTGAKNEKLFSSLSFDREGTPVVDYKRNKIGKQYNCTHIALWALLSLEEYIKTGEKRYVDSFLTQVNFLKSYVAYRGKKNAVWETRFDWNEGSASFKAPWIDAMTQGLVISVLVRAYKLTNDKNLLKLAEDATAVFSIDIKDGGVRAVEPEGVFYEEYPAYPLSFVLDGFIFSLLGLYDLYMTNNNPATLKLFNDGVDGLKNRLDMWNYKGYWSWYGSHGSLCSSMYNKLNACLLYVLGEITGIESFKKTAEGWMPANLTIKQKAVVHLHSMLIAIRWKLHEVFAVNSSKLELDPTKDEDLHGPKQYKKWPIMGKTAEEIGSREVKRISTIKQLIPKDVETILDVGCGDGIVCNPLSEKYAVTGVDVSREALGYVKTKTLLASTNKLPIKDDSFDLVLISDVLEHLPQIVFDETIKEIKRVSKKYIVINSPYKENLYLNRTKCKKCGFVYHLYWHLRSFSIEQIKKLFDGYTIVDLAFCGGTRGFYSTTVIRIGQSVGNNWHWCECMFCPKCEDVNPTKHKKNLIGIICLFLNVLLNAVIPPFLKHKSEFIILFKKPDYLKS